MFLSLSRHSHFHVVSSLYFTRVLLVSWNHQDYGLLGCHIVQYGRWNRCFKVIYYQRLQDIRLIMKTEAYCLLITRTLKMEAASGLKTEGWKSSKLWYPSTELHGATPQKVTMFTYLGLPSTRLSYTHFLFLAVERRIQALWINLGLFFCSLTPVVIFLQFCAPKIIGL
jgi:hypothetical protein